MDRVKQLVSHLTPGASKGRAALERKSPDDVVITLAIRSPLCKARKGGFKDTRYETSLHLQAIARSAVDPALVGDITVGTVLTPGSAYEARAAALTAGFPESVPVQTINRFCSSGLMAVTDISNKIRAGQIQIGLAVGVESMSQHPDSGGPQPSEEIKAHPSAKDCSMPMGWTSENVAEEFDISRHDMDEFAARSFQRAERAEKEGIFANEIVPFTAYVTDPATGQRTAKVVTKDDGIRYGTTKEGLLKIKAAFPHWGRGHTTGGNASQITDGAAAVLLMTRRKAEELGLKILGKHVTTSVAGLAPRIMGIGPSIAIPMALESVGITKDDINEAFASMYVYCVKKLGLDVEKVNVNGAREKKRQDFGDIDVYWYRHGSRGGVCWRMRSRAACGVKLWPIQVYLQCSNHITNERRTLREIKCEYCAGDRKHKNRARRIHGPATRIDGECREMPRMGRNINGDAKRPSPAMAANYQYHNTNAPSSNSPYGSGDPYYNESSGFITPHPVKKGTSNWVKIGVPVLVIVIVAAVVGGVVGSRAHKDSSSTSSTSGAAATGEAAASQAASIKNAIGVFPTATNSEYLLPLYPSTTNTAAYTTPTFNPSNNVALAWPQDPFQPSNPSPTSVRTDRPRLIAPSYKWQALPELIQTDPYLKLWNDTIFGNATAYYPLPPVVYHMDGDSGILDNAREIKMRIKAFSYVYRMTNDTKWVDRAFLELQNAAGNGTTSFGPDTQDKWNPTHFLDTAEFSAAFGYAYDWLYDAWTDTQKSQIRTSMLYYGLQKGVIAFSNSDNQFTGWWSNNTEGNWNCVCNGGLTVGALAILGDDTTGVAEQILSLTIDNAKQNCALAVSTDGTWAETANYWYFGTTGHAEMTSSLMTATGSDYGLLDVNADFKLTGLFHMYVTGPGSLFSYGDHGPNKFSTTANSILFYGDQFDHPEYVLFQRDQHDAPEPWSMFWYNPTVAGAFWDDMPLDHFFNNTLDQWAAMRSSWTDENALYAAIKAGLLTGHQNHNDLDCGDFVLDAMGTRWAGELGSGDYLSTNYFDGATQDGDRWLYYRKRTEGQNTILVNQENQLLTAAPTVNFDSSGTVQGSSTVMDVPSDSTAFFTADLTSAYNSTTSFKRGMRLLNGRKQVLLQDDINASGSIMWRMHTNATVAIDSSGTSATLTIGDQTLQMQILNAPSGVTITQGPATRFSNDPALPANQTDQLNPGVTVVMINMPAGTYSLQVLFNPQWSGMSASSFVTPPSVPIDSWTLTSHN
ncbi:3-ketoacyl-CoA thiolase 5, peroxisomal [Grifola frondosa]|uniref:3-ketoacyl-CoA thiolase 5, peroxisomal n=1 Tax=Grifola frondosa TaxID=5627 RepID=A0A1C7MR68_GRIFR|nr:3-ketoacyl-CoA thiolase 5, peroxisomal [Grifola frondosa]